jgi:integrase-like protein
VPLNDMALQVVRSQVGRHPVRVFTYEGKPIRQVSTAAWYKALARAGVGDFRWHDLRHTWASWHVQGGTPLFALQELAGWETEKMVRRYAHLAAEHLAVYAANTESHGTNTAQPPDFRGSPIASGEELRKFVVARGGIEPPTRGFSVQGSKRTMSLK